jgi:hypothetical protein
MIIWQSDDHHRRASLRLQDSVFSVLVLAELISHGTGRGVVQPADARARILGMVLNADMLRRHHSLT